MTANCHTKDELLQHYARLDKPALFRQIDVFTHEAASTVTPAAANQDSAHLGFTHEMMSGSVPVRVLISEGTTAAEVVRSLRLVIDLYEAHQYDHEYTDPFVDLGIELDQIHEHQQQKPPSTAAKI